MAILTDHVRVAGLMLSWYTELHKGVDEVGQNCLHIADSHGQLNMCKILLGQAADCSMEDKEQWTALHYAAEGGFLDFVVNPPTFKANFFRLLPIYDPDWVKNFQTVIFNTFSEATAMKFKPLKCICLNFYWSNFQVTGP